MVDEILDNEPVENTPQEQLPEQPSVEQLPEQSVEEQEQPKETPAPKAPENEPLSSKHFRRVLEEKEQIQRERDELLRLMQADKNRYAPQPEPEENFGIDENSFAEGKDLKRAFKEVTQLKRELQELKKKTAVEVTEARLKTEFPDFEKVFNKENIKILEAENPEFVETIAHSSADPYKVAKSMYKAIKQFGVYTPDMYENDRDRVQRNLTKPRPAVSASNRQSGNSPLAKVSEYAEDLTEERAAQLRAEVAKYKR